MNIKSEEKEYRLDFAKWIVVAALVALGVYGNSHFSAHSVFLRAVGLIVLAGAHCRMVPQRFIFPLWWARLC